MILCISGLKRSGKDTIGNMLIKKHNFKRIAMADSLKQLTARVMELPENYFFEDTLKDAAFASPFIFDEFLAHNLAFELNELGYDVTPSLFNSKIGKVLETPRDALVYIGTHVCRNLIDENIWLDIALKKIKNTDGHIVVTDARFKNERDAIKSIGGITMFVDRPEISKKFNFETADISEKDQLSDSYDVFVVNDRSIQLLEFEIDMWLNNKVKTLR